MNRLNELADAIDPTQDSRNYSPGLAKEAAALLRAAACEKVGTEWEWVADPRQDIVNHNREIAAARLAVADARAERDEAVNDLKWIKGLMQKDLDAANAERDALQRAIDEAYGRWLLSSEMSTTSDSMARVLCPHATRREEPKAMSEAVTRVIDSMAEILASPTADADEKRAALATISEAVFPTECVDAERMQPEPRQWSSTPPSDRSGRWWNAYKRPNRPPATVLFDGWEIDAHPAVGEMEYDLWLPHLDGDTRDTLPPLPNHSETPKSSPVPTRELVARLAEVVRGVMFFKASQDEIDAIIRDAKGGAE